MKNLKFVTISLSVFIFFGQLASATNLNKIALKCSDNFYSFEIVDFDGNTGVIKTSGNYGDLTVVSFKKTIDQPFKNYVLFLDELNRKISISKKVLSEGVEVIKLYFNNYKYNCSVH